MKKISLKWMAALFVAIVSLSFVACGDDDEKEKESGNTETPIDPVEPTKDEAMSPVEQKEYLETVALELMDKIPATDFQDLADMGTYINETYIKGYDWDNVERWAKDAFNSSREALGTSPTTKLDEEYYGSKYYSVYTNYKALLLASNFTGHFTANNGHWIQAAGNDLQFFFTDKRGRQCVLQLVTSGKVKKVNLLNVDDWTGYKYEDNGNTYSYYDYFDRTQYTIGIPEKIVVTLTQGGSKVIETEVKIDLGSITGEEFNISKDNLTVSALTSLYNGYEINVNKVAYTANTQAELSFSINKNGSSLVAMGISGNVTGLPSVNVSDLTSEDYHSDEFNNVNGKNAFAKLDILGKVQIQGTLSDVRKFADYIEEASDHNKDEKNYKSYINQANALADVSLFFDGKNVKQANIKLETFADEDWYNGTYWKAEPVIYFFDGSSYSTFEAFFNQRDFKITIDTFKDLADKYAKLVD